MPKIFLIKNRLHLQQLKLLETQKNRDESVSLSPPGSPLNEPQPLSLIVNKSVESLLISCFSEDTLNRRSRLPKKQSLSHVRDLN
ncbi:hypothetical protein LSTR_LSTR016093 [Laodelphax striatellus]|uniref:Uncharacterized protein n=1 Tax=Laodelphax striatellus TaxID=195883 RepID=A0A482XDY2_LAOST|nr:hypothetical protein LSTR_LSTR016093 [Laodelphax striatellus]